MSPVFVGNIDVTLVTFYAFVLFFFGLVIYLNRESRREGFPLEDDLTGRLDSKALINDASPKLFRLPFGRGMRSTADYGRDPIDQPATRERFSGAPLRPTGNPLIDAIGPAAFANRRKEPDLDMEGHPRIVPMSSLNSFSIDKRDRNPVGLPVIAADGITAGTVTDLWIDRAESLIRYLQVDTGTRMVQVPFAMCAMRRNRVICNAVNAASYADAPVIDGDGSTITFYDEDRVQGYFGGGYLYANADRQEPLI